MLTLLGCSPIRCLQSSGGAGCCWFSGSLFCLRASKSGCQSAQGDSWDPLSRRSILQWCRQQFVVFTRKWNWRGNACSPPICWTPASYIFLHVYFPEKNFYQYGTGRFLTHLNIRTFWELIVGARFLLSEFPCLWDVSAFPALVT